MNRKKISQDQKDNILFDFSAIESYWQSKWEIKKLYQPDLESAKKPFYNLMMFPYPSAEGLHMGSVFTFSGVDIYGRFKSMRGYDVFEPIGLDGFGIHSENHAIKTRTHPIDHAKMTENNFYRQLGSIGNAFDWRTKLETYDPKYYKWTQWLFVQLFKEGLAYRKKSPVNFCPSCKTVLADEQVIEAKCERCGSLVEKRELEQWFFRITNFAGRLLGNLEKINWTEKVKIAQKNWIGKSEGINISYKIENIDYEIEVFTTRPDTNFGATFIALSPEYDFVKRIINGEFGLDDLKRREIVRYAAKASSNKTREEVRPASKIMEKEGKKKKTGVFTGFYAINKLTGYKIPVWISDFVLSGYGTGALVGVPAHDTRDFEFAQQFGLEIKRVVVGSDGDNSPVKKIEQVQEGSGKIVNSGFLDGLQVEEAIKKIMGYIEQKGFGKRKTVYRLRDWLISRQRYWGPPIPMIYCENCKNSGKSWFTYKGLTKTNDKIPNPAEWDSAGWYPVEEEELPVKLPYIEDFKPEGSGKSPLANYPDFYQVKCPACKSEAKRETDVSDTFLDSSWYFLRYLATDSDDMPFPSKLWQNNLSRNKSKSSEKQIEFEAARLMERKRFLPVTMYIGGAEHSVLHLLYARFITMALCDMGYLDFEEPFARFYAHGLIIKDGAKMSKSRGNVINPDEYLTKYGIDTTRTYLHFLGPFSDGGDFRDSGIEGINRFLKRVWKLFMEVDFISSERMKEEESKEKERLKQKHLAIKGVTDDLENLRYNTAIAKLMSWYNFLAKQNFVTREEAGTYVKLLAPFAPYMCEELWQSINGRPGHKTQADSFELEVNKSVHRQAWPEYKAEYLDEVMVTIAVQVNGKLRYTVDSEKESAMPGESGDQKAKNHIEKLALQNEKSKQYIKEFKILKVIYIPGKVINFVVS
jgi:leucyl-tRNA synthetase